MYHTGDYSILMTLVSKLYTIYNSMKSRRIFSPIEAIENFLVTSLEPAKSILIFQVWPAPVTKGVYIFLILLTWVNQYFSYTYPRNTPGFISKRCYDMEYTVSSWNMHLLIAVTERVIYTSLFLLSPNKMKFIDLLLANMMHVLWLNKALKMKIFCPSHEVYRSKLNEQVKAPANLEKGVLACSFFLRIINWSVNHLLESKPRKVNVTLP